MFDINWQVLKLAKILFNLFPIGIQFIDIYYYQLNQYIQIIKHDFSDLPHSFKQLFNSYV